MFSAAMTAMRSRPITLPLSRICFIRAFRNSADSSRAFRSLAGRRGRPRGDLEALARAVAALSHLAVQAELAVVEAEVNPLLVMPQGQGVLAVDALVVPS